MRKTIIFISLAVVLGFCILSQNTKYYFAGCIIFMALLSLNSFKELYKYQKGKQCSNNGLILKRENLSWKIISLVYFTAYFAINFLFDKLTVVGVKEIIMVSSILIYAIVNVYSIIWQKPILFEDGILLSNGDFILLDNIKKANIEDKDECDKKLIVNCDKGDCVFRFKDSDYESVKKLILSY